MRGFRIHEHGGTEVLRLEDLPEPQPGAGDVVVRVTHVGLNHLDLWVRGGVPGHRFPLPLVPGSDVVGVREDTGEPVALFPARSCGACRWCTGGRADLCRGYRIRGEGMDGGMCQRVTVPEAALLPCPLPPHEAAAMPLALLTAWHMLLGRAHVGPGDRVLVQGGTSGVGSMAIQVARLAGAQVVATASTPEKRAMCLALGAEQAWPAEGSGRAARGWAGAAGVDIVVEHVGAATWSESLAALRWGGTLVTCGATAGATVSLDLRALFFKQLSLLGSTMGSMAEMLQAWELVVQGRIRPVVHAVMSMRALAEAHELLEGRSVIGKLVLEQDLA